MDHPVAMGVVEGVGHRGDELGGLAERERPVAVAQDAGQRPPLDELLDQVERPVVGLSGLVERDDAGVLELGRAAGLAQEPLCVLVAGQAARPRDLDRHHPAQLDVTRPEHVAVGAGPQPLHQLELSQSVVAFVGREPGRRAARGPVRSHGRDQLLGYRLASRSRPSRPTAATAREGGRRARSRACNVASQSAHSSTWAATCANNGPGRLPMAKPWSSARSGQSAAPMGSAPLPVLDSD